MSWTRTNYRDVEAVGEGMHFLRDPLECQRLGLTVVECEPGWTGMQHDHADDDHEEVYLLLEGQATITVEEDRVEMEPGDALHVPADATRQIQNGDSESRLVVAGAP